MHIAAEHSYRDIGLITLYDGDVKGLSGTRGSLSWKPWRAFTNVSTNGGIGTGTKMEHVTGPSVHNCHEYMHIIFFYHVAALHFPIALVESQCLEVSKTQRFPSDRQYKSFLGIAQSEIQVNENSFFFFVCIYMGAITALLGLPGDFKAPERTIFDLKKLRKYNKAARRAVESKDQACNIKETVHLSPAHNSLREQAASSHLDMSHPFLC